MNYLDYIICIPLLWGAYKGFTKGFLFEIALLIGLFLGVYGAFRFSNIASNYLSEHFHLSPTLLPFVSFLVVFAAIIIVILLGAKLLGWAISLTPLGIANKIAGALIGMLKWTFIVSAICFAFAPIDDQFHLINENIKQKSVLYKPLNMFASYVIPEVKSHMNTPFQQKTSAAH